LAAAGAGVVEVVPPRAGTGGITIFATSTPLGGFGSAFLIRRLAPEGFLAEDFLAAAFLAAAFFATAFFATAFFATAFFATAFFATAFFAKDFLAGRFALDFLATDFLAALFFAGRADFFLVATLAPSILEVSLTSPTESLLAGAREVRHLAGI
jgi:hypothetical protein